MSTRRATRATVTLPADNHAEEIPCPLPKCPNPWTHQHDGNVQYYLARPEAVAAYRAKQAAHLAKGSKRRAEGSPGSEDIVASKKQKNRKITVREESAEPRAVDEPVRMRGLSDKHPIIMPKHLAGSSDWEDDDAEDDDVEDDDAEDDDDASNTQKDKHRKTSTKEDSMGSSLSEELSEEDESSESESEVSEFIAEDTENDTEVDMTNEDDLSDSDLSSAPAADSGAEDEGIASPTHDEEDGQAMDVDDDPAQSAGSPKSPASLVNLGSDQTQGAGQKKKANNHTSEQADKGETNPNKSNVQPPNQVTPDVITAGHHPTPRGWTPPNPYTLQGPFTSPDYRPTGEDIAHSPFIAEMTKADQLALANAANLHTRITNTGRSIPVASPIFYVPPTTPGRESSPTESELEFQYDASPHIGRSLFGPFQ